MALKLNDSPKYRTFINERDKALEKILLKYQAMISDTLAGLFQRVVEIVSYNYKRTPVLKMMLSQIDQNLEVIFDHAADQIASDIIHLKQSAYVLSYAGEAEAIARATGGGRYSITNDKIHKVTLQRSEIQQKVKYYLDKRKRRIMDALQLSLIQDDDTNIAVERVKRVIPLLRAVKKAKKVLKPLKEAQKDNETPVFDLSTGYVDEQSWSDMVDDYRSEYIPKYRDPNTTLSDVPADADLVYGWELEKEINHEFVQQVRDGQVEAADENGITDFVWLAVLDDRTDECCVWRDGMTSSEISLALQNDHRDDDCDGAITPPAHFNCRCAMAPVYKDEPTAVPDNLGEFLDWLNN